MHAFAAEAAAAAATAAEHYADGTHSQPHCCSLTAAATHAQVSCNPLHTLLFEL